MILGSHTSMKAPDFIAGSVLEAVSYGANALMIYTGAPQNTRRTEVSKLKVEQAHQLLKQHNIALEHVVVHAPYIINLANTTKKQVSDLAVEFLQMEVQRVQEMGFKYLVLHPGSYVDGTMEAGLQSIIDGLNSISNDKVMILLETMAGKGTEIGFEFKHLKTILDNLHTPEQFGVCLDTCHIHDAGYDVRDVDGILNHFDDIIGLEKLRVIHINDSKNKKGDRKDRHANIDDGHIGFETLHRFCHHPKLQSVIKILETPWIDGKAPYKEEIELLRKI